MKKELKYLTFPFELKEVDEEESTDKGIIEGYASTFGNMDQGLDIVVKGAFTKTIKETGGIIPILADHMPTKQLGWNTKAKEDSTGLFVRGELDLNVQLAKERYSLAKSALKLGAPAGISIGYYTILSEMDKANPRIRLLKELRLFEYSLVTFPMNVEAMVTAAKSVGAIDKLKALIQYCKDESISAKDLEIALRNEAATVEFDPTKISQSLDTLLLKMKN